MKVTDKRKYKNIDLHLAIEAEHNNKYNILKKNTELVIGTIHHDLDKNEIKLSIVYGDINLYIIDEAHFACNDILHP